MRRGISIKENGSDLNWWGFKIKFLISGQLFKSWQMFQHFLSRVFLCSFSFNSFEYFFLTHKFSRFFFLPPTLQLFIHCLLWIFQLFIYSLPLSKPTLEKFALMEIEKQSTFANAEKSSTRVNDDLLFANGKTGTNHPPKNSNIGNFSCVSAPFRFRWLGKIRTCT